MHAYLEHFDFNELAKSNFSLLGVATFLIVAAIIYKSISPKVGLRCSLVLYSPSHTSSNQQSKIPLLGSEWQTWYPIAAIKNVQDRLDEGYRKVSLKSSPYTCRSLTYVNSIPTRCSGCLSSRMDL